MEFCLPQEFSEFREIYSFEGILDSVQSRSSVLSDKVLTHNHAVEGKGPRDNSQSVIKVSSHLLPR